MAWLESHQALGNHPKTKKAARALKISTPAMVGHLHYLWWWALDFAQDGDVSHFSAEDIAEAALWKKNAETFVQALTDAGVAAGRAGFLERTDDGRLVIHDWWAYAGKLIEKRRSDAARKRGGRTSSADDNGRPEEIQRTSDGHPTEVAGTNQPTNPTVPTNQPTRWGEDLDQPLRDRVLDLLEAIGWKYVERETYEGTVQICEEYDDDAIRDARAKLRREPGSHRPFPGNLRKHLAPLPETKPRPMEVPSISELFPNAGQVRFRKPDGTIGVSR